MIKAQPIEKILQATLASGKLKDERPLSVIIIANPESGKTNTIRKYCLKSGNVFYTTDATAYGIIKDSNKLEDFSSGEITHIVIPDLLTCLGRKHDTVNTFIHFMNALIEEGVVNISTYATHIKGDIEARVGLITAITPTPFKDRRRHWGDIGFLSRALPVSYEYQLSTKIKIFEYIKSQRHLEEELEKLELPHEPQTIELPHEIANKIEPFALNLAASHSQFQQIYGFRYQRQLQTLVKALALLKGKNEVDDECIKELEKLADYINLDFNKI
jgi:hypothetical protein